MSNREGNTALKMAEVLIILSIIYSSVIFLNVHAQTVGSYVHKRSSNLHTFMNNDQLRKYYGVEEQEDVPNYEVVDIWTSKRSNIQKRQGMDDSTYSTTPDELIVSAQSVFGQQVQMILQRNSFLLAPEAKVVKASHDSYEDEPAENYRQHCYYLGNNGSIVGALRGCEDSVGVSGILLLSEGGVQIEPIGHDLLQYLEPSDSRSSYGHPHVVSVPTRSKRLSVIDEWEDENYIPSNPREDYEIDDNEIMNFGNDDFDDLNSISNDPVDESDGKILKEEKPNKKRSGTGKLFMELALFFDEKAYEMFMPHMKSEEKLVDLMLGYVNQIQAVYFQKSLKRRLHISLVHLEMMRKQPRDLPHADGERDKLLDNFCAYQAKKNPPSDSDPNHWDVALYISGLNFYAMEKGEKNGVTMGLAPVGGACLKQHSCVIAEFGTVSEDGKPYPSAGLLSTYVAVHEIGHNLGMYHDGPPNNKCPTNGHVMSPSRGTKGETTWSQCSAEVLQKMNKECLMDQPKAVPKERDHSKFDEKPGQVWDAHDQCKIFLRDPDATLLNDTVISMVCEQTLCKSPHRIGYYAAGPALEGTFCGGSKWCTHGECVNWGAEKPKIVKGGWSEWSKGKCSSGCIAKARGVHTDKRICDNPKPRNTEKFCEGDNIRIHFCDDDRMCKKRLSPTSHASDRCKEFSRYLPEVTPVGVQVKYNEKRQWQSCAVYCKMKTGTWYTPRQELNDRGIDTFFPDGTWCHNNGKTDYHCQNHLCQPPPPKGRSIPSLGKSRGRNPEVDVPYLNNAYPKGDNSAPAKLKEYFQYVEGRNPPPLPGADELKRPRDEDLWIIDY